MENNTVEYWKNTKPGDVILLSDKQAVEDSKKYGKGYNPLPYFITEIIRFEDLNKLGKTELFLLTPQYGDQQVTLVIKIVDQYVGLRIYYQPEDFPVGSRKDMISKEMFWLFLPPKDTNNYSLNELNFTGQIFHEENGKKFIYNQKSFGEIQGTVDLLPPPSGIEDLIGTITEYITDEKIENPELMLFELGMPNAEGIIKLYLGCDANFNEIELLRRA